MVTDADVLRLAKIHFPEKKVQKITDLGIWLRHTFKVQFENSPAVLYKFHVNPELNDGSVHEYRVTEILKYAGLPAAEIIVVDKSRRLIDETFIVVAEGSGERLDRIIKNHTVDSVSAAYYALGAFYRKMHKIRAKKSGVWEDDPRKVIDLAPNDILFENEIVQGSALRLAEKKIITDLTHQRIIDLWQQNLPYLRDHQAVMVHGSAFPWNIYLRKHLNSWEVTRTSALADSLWWDAAYDVALLTDPPFTWMFEEWRIAFWEGYGHKLDARRLLLYRLLQIISAVNDVFMQPESPDNEPWKQMAINSIPQIIKSLEGQI